MPEASNQYRRSQITGWVASAAFILCVLPIFVCKPDSAPDGVSWIAHKVSILGFVFAAAATVELYWYKSFAPYFSFSNTKKLNRQSFRRIVLRCFSLMLLLLLSSIPVSLIDLFYAPVLNLFLLLSPMLFLIGVLYFLLLERYSSIPTENDDWITLSQSVLSLARSAFKNNSQAGTISADKRSAMQTFLLSVLLRSFFATLMLAYYVDNFRDLEKQANCLSQITNTPGEILFSGLPVLYRLLIRIICTFDCILGVLGYISACHIFSTQVRSVDKTIVGWLVTLLCYHPFFILDQFAKPVLTYACPEAWLNRAPIAWCVASFVLFLLTLFYVCCSICFGLAFSNLTNRGIINTGPYGIIRHPAYASKIISWWICTIPICLQENLKGAVFTIAGMLIVTLIFYLRAITEEKHLSADPAYTEYCRMVRWRFIPGLV